MPGIALPVLQAARHAAHPVAALKAKALKGCCCLGHPRVHLREGHILCLCVVRLP